MTKKTKSKRKIAKQDHSEFLEKFNLPENFQRNKQANLKQNFGSRFIPMQNSYKRKIIG